MKPRLPSSLLSAAALFGLLAAATLHAQQPSGQWDFDSGNLTGTVGQPLTYVDGPSGPTSQGTAFNTTTGFGIPDIGGTPANVMRFPAATDLTMGYLMPNPPTANGGGTFVNDWTIIMDLLYTGASHGAWRGLMDTDAGGIDADGEFFINNNNQLGVGNYFGTISSNTWHRVGIVVQASQNRIYFYIDGTQVGFRDGASGGTAALDGRWALSPSGTSTLFTDDNAETAIGYVNSIQLRAEALTKPQMAALAGAQATGIPTTLPPVPSFVEEWIPRGENASRDTDIGAVINPGSTTIQDSSISLTLDGQPVASPTITRPDGLIRVEATPASPFQPATDHTVILTLTDSLDGQKSFTNEFAAALFYEDFDGIVLGPNKDEGSVSENAWTNRPPEGWSIDNSQFPAVVITVDNPDSDGDGFADNDGITEWAGWSFARREWWVSVDDQTRSQFLLASGNVAVADPDEWDDTTHAISLFNSYLVTPPISLAGLAENSAFLTFASSWRPEGRDDDDAGKFPVGPNGEAINNQTAIITVSYDGGAPIELLKWDSISGSPTFHPDSQNESVLLQLNNPSGATNAVITFALLEGANDWWWAIDNVVINAGASPPLITTQPKPVIASAGADVTLSVRADGTAPLTYQWKHNGADISGEVGQDLVIDNIQAADAGQYQASVSNAAGSVLSTTVEVGVFSGSITQDLVVHLKFDNDLADASGRGNNGSAVGAPTFVAGKIGANAVNIPSGSDYVSLGTPADLNFGTDTDFSLSFWTRLVAFDGDPSFIGNKDWDSGGNPGYVLATDGDRRIQWNFAGPSGSRKDFDSGGGFLTESNWHHVVVTFARNKFASCYVDGVLATGGANPTSLDTPNDVNTPDGLGTNIGQDGTGSYGSAFSNMDMDDVGIWRRVVTPQEVLAIYNAGLAGDDLTHGSASNPTPPVEVTGQWDFNDGDLGASIGADLTYRGDTAATFVEMSIGGQPAQVMGFPATTPEQGFVMPHGALPNGGGARVNRYTLIMDLMFPTTSTGVWRGLLQVSPDNSNDGEFFVNDGNGIGISGAYHGQILADTWHRVAFAVDLTESTVGKFIDGVLVNRQTLGEGVDGRWSLDATALLFADNDSETAAGFVNSIQFRNGTMSESEIAALGGATAAGIPLPGVEVQIDEIQLNGGNITIGWTAEPGRRLQKSATLSPPAWTDVPGTDGTNTFTEAVSGTAFYRLFQP